MSSSPRQVAQASLADVLLLCNCPLFSFVRALLPFLPDRSKDVIKSGGEWISSIDLENEVMAHPAVGEAAVIGLEHPKYTERPLLIVVRKPSAEGAALTGPALLAWLAQRVAKWWVPEAVEFVTEIPHTATGKIKKVDLRKKFKGYKWPLENQAVEAAADADAELEAATIRSKL